ncbi:MAG TPA: hypothetical protein VLJ88_18090 [Propionibacteriaceae bacterium]|nr:hypothetical protein [Propionibacteriaceae bacterium]
MTADHHPIRRPDVQLHHDRSSAPIEAYDGLHRALIAGGAGPPIRVQPFDLRGLLIPSEHLAI